MLTVSPAVSPKVVARILMIQKPSVIAGTLVRSAVVSQDKDDVVMAGSQQLVETHDLEIDGIALHKQALSAISTRL
ncbi:hypothetical protein GCM10010989_24750 [Croceicoccus pelagius]|uniref:Uncharacterized protein n=1 Tax=Croceicoccus pelagius TaxID=1703341 RepID=A0A916YL35_9SPHN|nr:hypothetical protein GCM10010989_24750 [Croceicoccus pelagius]